MTVMEGLEQAVMCAVFLRYKVGLILADKKRYTVSITHIPITCIYVHKYVYTSIYTEDKAWL